MKAIADILNKFIQERDYARYLEIGVFEGETFKKIECEEIQGIEINPLFNDERVFEGTVEEFKSRKKYDVIFIDGGHDYESVKKDYEFALTRLKKGGIIAFHDILPPTEWHTRPKEEYKFPQEWCGQALDVFLESQLKNWTDDTYLPKVYTNVPFGLGILDSTEISEGIEKLPEDFNDKIETILKWKVL